MQANQKKTTPEKNDLRFNSVAARDSRNVASTKLIKPVGSGNNSKTQKNIDLYDAAYVSSDSEDEMAKYQARME